MVTPFRFVTISSETHIKCWRFFFSVFCLKQQPSLIVNCQKFIHIWIVHVHFNHHNFTSRRTDKYVESISAPHFFSLSSLNRQCFNSHFYPPSRKKWKKKTILLLIEYSVNVDEQAIMFALYFELLPRCDHYAVNVC